ncbi:MAG: hypothetical protein H2069_01470 [Legionella sp.]|nr:hypothetical protein [Legionella sp.]
MKLNEYDKNAIKELGSESIFILQKRAFDRTNFDLNMEYLNSLKTIQFKLLKILDRYFKIIDEHVQKKSEHRWHLFKSKPDIQITTQVNYIDKDRFEIIETKINKTHEAIANKKFSKIHTEALALLYSKKLRKTFKDEFDNRKIKALGFKEDSSTATTTKTMFDTNTTLSVEEKNTTTYWITFSDNSILTYNPLDHNGLDQIKTLFNKKIAELPSKNLETNVKNMEQKNSCCQIF